MPSASGTRMGHMARGLFRGPLSGPAAAPAHAVRMPSGLLSQRRYLHLHEYQSMDVMKEFSVPTPLYSIARSPEAAQEAARVLASEASASRRDSPLNYATDFVIKAQVLCGGRGLGHFVPNGFQGGVHVCSSPDEVGRVAANMLGNTLVTKQTGATGRPCSTVLIAERLYLRREKYLALLMDRSSGGPLLLGSSVGGTSIEEIAAKHPETVVRQPIDISRGLGPLEARAFAERLSFGTATATQQATDMLINLYRMFLDRDCLMLEINPLGETIDGRVLACDAKVNFDDNADYRQTKLFAQRDTSQEDVREVQATAHGLNYVALNGNIGCMVNGAGLAMATMDLVLLHGGSPANFLDVGGGSGGRQIVEALRILQSDPQVDSIFVNIFGGIMRCDIIARGLIEASATAGLAKPLVLRLEGTNKDLAASILKDSGASSKFVFEEDFNEAARKAVKLAAIVKLARDAKLNVSFS